MEYSSFIKAGGNLAIENVQDKDSYTSHNENKGMGLSIGSMKKTIDNNKMKSSLKGGLAVGTSKSNIDSTYESVTNQAGITAGSQGYEVSVKDTTHLKGGLIDSHASQDKNTLTTGTLVWEDIENKADYKATASGRNYGASWSPKETVGDKKVGGLTGGTSPVKSQPVKGKAESITKSAVSEGAITITDKEHQKQDISDLNRDTKNTLNQLEKIFDKEKVQERQALANEFAKLGAEKIGDIAKEKGWDKNDTRRTLLHGLLGGITAKLGGNNVLSGVMAEGGMESLQPLLDNFLKDHPDMREEVASIFGYATGKLFGGDGDVGSATAWSGTKFNWLNHEQNDAYREELAKATTAEEKEAIIKKYREINDQQDDEWEIYQPADDYIDPFYGDIGKISVNGQKSMNDSEASWSDRALSFSTNFLGTRLNTIGDYIANEYDKTLLKGATRVGIIGTMFTMPINYITESQVYSGEDLQKALLIDSKNTFKGMTAGALEIFGRERFLKRRLMGWSGNILDFGAAIALGMHYDEIARREKEEAGLKTNKEKDIEAKKIKELQDVR